MDADSFGQWLREQREGAGLSQEELAGAVGVGKAFISKLENATKHTSTGVSPSPSLETFVALIKKLNVPLSPPLEKLIHGRSPEPTEPVDIELRKLAGWYKDLPRECQKDFLALAESLWRRRRAEGRVERSSKKDSAKHRPQTEKPGVVRRKPRTGTEG